MDVLLESKTKPVSTISVYSYIPPRRTEPKERTYYNSDSKESSRPAPVLSSSEYGRRLPPLLYTPGRQFARISHIHTEFFRKNGITRNFEEGYGSVVPV
ncbi:unnamed protein product [Coregonus sp. 'balchen']|nr:unnamed protein product [Coregonus sp. 'balchen']